MKFPAIAVQKLQPEQIDRQTDWTEIITYPHTRMVNMRTSKRTEKVIQLSNVHRKGGH